MKKLKPLYFISLCILFQSCSNYKSVEYNDIRNNEKQKFKIVNKDQLKVKGKLVNKDDEKITLVTFDGKTLTIPKEEINELKIKKFSILKTTGYLGIQVLGGIGIVAVIVALASTG